MSIAGFIKSWILIALGVVVAAHFVSGISYSSTEALVYAVLILSILNLVLKPLLVLFTLPLVVLTMGLFIVIINAFLFILAGKLVAGFEVASFMSALFGALIVGFVSFIVDGVLGPRR